LASDAELERFSRYELGWCYYRMGKETVATKIFDDYLTRYPDSDITADIIFWFAQSYYGKGLYGRAKISLNRVIVGFPKSALIDDANYLLGWILYREGKLEPAIEQLESVITRYPNSDSAYNAAIALGDILTESGKYEEAVESLEHLLAHYQDQQFQKIINKKIGLIYQSKGFYSKSVSYYRKALTADDNDFNAELQFRIAECMEDESRFDNAISEYLKVGYLHPNSRYWAMRARLRTAQILEAQERWLEARKMYEEIALEDAQEAKHARERLRWMDKHKDELR